MDHDRDRPVDFFISHASEDKSSFVRDLVDQLLRIGASVFYDEYSIEYGQSLTASINSGMSRAKNVVVEPRVLREVLDQQRAPGGIQPACWSRGAPGTRVSPGHSGGRPEALSVHC
jgi:hypothetical protein